jgi:hypothetical protein
MPILAVAAVRLEGGAEDEVPRRHGVRRAGYFFT